MRNRIAFGSGVAVFILLLTLVIWQGSFTFGDYGPSSPEQRSIFWAISTLVFLLTVTVGFMLFRTFVKLYMERQSNREGSSIRTKLVVGALLLSFLPVFFLVLWSYHVLNRNLDKWFGKPAEDIRLNLVETLRALENDTRQKALAQAHWLALLPETRNYLITGERPPGFFEELCRQNDIEEARVERKDGVRLTLFRSPAAGVQTLLGEGRKAVEARAPFRIEGEPAGELFLRTRIPIDLAEKQMEIHRRLQEYDELAIDKRDARAFYLQLLLLITLFVLFVATWMALFLARQISIPISALLDAAREVRGGNLSYRVKVHAMDELALLVRSFNEMTQELGAHSRELERRRRFTEAILESIPTGVISLSSDGRIQRVNRALKNIFSEGQVALANRLSDLFSHEDTREIEYLMKRARRTGLASRQLELKSDDGRTLHLSVTVSALDEQVRSGFVLVLEDTSELLRAQKATAWHEIARRVAHEIKNPLTPIALCAERISRQIDRLGASNDVTRILHECSDTICNEVESVKTLVNEFSQFARFPAAQPVPSDLNEVVENALAVFAGRLDGIGIRKELAPGLPQVCIDREQFKRVIVNLVDNAAEAMQDSPVKRLYIATAAAGDTVELVISDTGCGVSAEDKEKLFLPYFSTKNRGTGLGLAIVNHIVSEHNATVRIEDNHPSGARFIVEIAAMTPSDSEWKPVEARA